MAAIEIEGRRYSRALRVFENNPELWPAKFQACIRENPAIWRSFVNHAMVVIRKGFKHYSTRTIVCVMRHHTALSEVGSEFKINDHHSPYFARLFDEVYPEHAGLFEKRTSAMEKAG